MQTRGRVGSADQLSLIDAGVQKVKIRPIACGLGDRLEFNVLVRIDAVALPDLARPGLLRFLYAWVHQV